MSKLKFYEVSREYILFLQNIDPTVMNYGGMRGGIRMYVGFVHSVGSVDFVAPLTSYKSNQDRIRSDSWTVFKMEKENQCLGMINLGRMIPVLPLEIRQVDFSAHQEVYGNLLSKQYECIKANQNKIKEKASKLYNNIIKSTDDSGHFKKFSCNFGSLLQKHKLFHTESGNSRSFGFIKQ